MKRRWGYLLDLACALWAAVWLLPLLVVVTLMLLLAWAFRPMHLRRAGKPR